MNPDNYKSFYYRNYYATQVKFHAGKSTWSSWNKRFAPLFTKLQQEDGSWRSPNVPDDVEKSHGHEDHYGIGYPTSLAALSLMVYYRNLPTFQEKAVTEDVAEVEDSDDVELELL